MSKRNIKITNWLILTFNLFLLTILLCVLSVNNCTNTNFPSPETRINSKRDIFIKDPNSNSENPAAGFKDLHFDSPNGTVVNRLYMDSSGDKSLPTVPEGSNDKTIGKGSKDTWYEFLVSGLSIDTTLYANDKNDFLEKYKSINFNYFYKFNFWTSKYGWAYRYGKKSPTLVDSKIFNLTADNKTYNLFYASNEDHHNNESAKLDVIQNWNENILSFNFKLCVSYHWQAGSTIKHASLTTFSSEYYSFTGVPPFETSKDFKTDIISNISKFKIDSSSQIPLIDFDKKIDDKSKERQILESSFKATSIFVQGYFGIKTVQNLTYIFSIRLIWEGLPNDNSTLILNGFNMNRNMFSTYENQKLYFNYENDIGGKEQKGGYDINENMVGMEMEGFIFLPFIYSGMQT